MSGSSLYVVLLTSALLSTKLAVITGQLLTTEYLNVKLPRAACPAAHYDGDDSIFLFSGGCYGDASPTDILKFSVSSGTLQNVGRVPGNAVKGTLQSDNFGNIFFLGGYAGGGNPSSTDIHKFDPVINRVTTVATLPYDVYSHISIKLSETSNTILILGGTEQIRDISSFDMETLARSTLATNLPHNFYQGTSVRVGNKAFIFDDTKPYHNKFALELNLDTLNVQPVGVPTLPDFDGVPSSVWDGTHVYVIGGYESGTGAPTNGLIQFNPETFFNNFIFVRNFPVEGRSYFEFAPAAVFVPSNNRIYFFGGESYNYSAGFVRHDEIFYIDLKPPVQTTLTTSTTTLTPSTTTLTTSTTTMTTSVTPSTTTVTPSTSMSSSSSTLNPDLFTCNNQPNGFYPHPTDCSLYIGCQNEELTVFRCPSPLLFDPVRKACNYPEDVECGPTSSVNRPDGSFYILITVFCTALASVKLQM